MSVTQTSQDRSETPQLRAVLAAVRRIMHAADLRSRRLARETGLTAPQLAVLQAIADLGEVTTGRISADVSLSQATVTVILDRLMDRGLVERYRSPVDRRVVYSRLTKAGQQALHQHRQIRPRLDRRQKIPTLVGRLVVDPVGALR